MSDVCPGLIFASQRRWMKLFVNFRAPQGRRCPACPVFGRRMVQQACVLGMATDLAWAWSEAVLPKGLRYEYEYM